MSERGLSDKHSRAVVHIHSSLTEIPEWLIMYVTVIVCYFRIYGSKPRSVSKGAALGPYVAVTDYKCYIPYGDDPLLVKNVLLHSYTLPACLDTIKRL